MKGQDTEKIQYHSSCTFLGMQGLIIGFIMVFVVVVFHFILKNWLKFLFGPVNIVTSYLTYFVEKYQIGYFIKKKKGADPYFGLVEKRANL